MSNTGFIVSGPGHEDKRVTSAAVGLSTAITRAQRHVKEAVTFYVRDAAGATVHYVENVEGVSVVR